MLPLPEIVHQSAIPRERRYIRAPSVVRDKQGRCLADQLIPQRLEGQARQLAKVLHRLGTLGVLGFALAQDALHLGALGGRKALRFPLLSQCSEPLRVR